MPVFFIQTKDVIGKTIHVQNPLFSHLVKSLRVRVGERILLNDEQGHRYHTTIEDIHPTLLIARIDRIEMQSQSPQRCSITLGQSVLKGEKMGWVIQKATELGAATIVPLLTDHTIPRLSPESGMKHHTRWERIALEAAQQSERWSLPEIAAPQTLEDFLASSTSGNTMDIVLTERGDGEPVSRLLLARELPTSIRLLVGPEGGWSEKEKDTFQARGWLPASLGSNILRAETASLAALAILLAYGEQERGRNWKDQN